MLESVYFTLVRGTNTHHYHAWSGQIPHPGVVGALSLRGNRELVCLPRSRHSLKNSNEQHQVQADSPLDTRAVGSGLGMGAARTPVRMGARQVKRKAVIFICAAGLLVK